MAENQITLSFPLTSASIFPFSNIPWNGSTAPAQAITLRDPITGAGLPIDPVNGLVVQGGVRVTNLPATQTVSGTINVGNLPGTQPVSGSVSVSNLPATQAVSLTNGPCQNSSGTGIFPEVCDAFAVIDQSTAGTFQLIAGVAGKQIRITGFFFTCSNATGGTVQLVHGASNTPLTGALAVVAESGVNVGGAEGALYTLPAGDDLSIILTGSATAQGTVFYTVR